MTWNRKYRPRQISELHLEKVRELLLSLMAQGRLPQVLLFAGPKGTGKTSTARIIGALLNDSRNETVVRQLYFQKDTVKGQSLLEPNPEDHSLDKIFEGSSYLVQELDAASNRGIDDVRALRERVALPPQEGLMSVYILDEAHMLTTEAFNALLKLLEEPPEHAVFILATTELHKIPATIVSRSTVIPFTKATIAELMKALQIVSEKEQLSVQPEALGLIAAFADGSFRDAIKALELMTNSGQVVSVDLVNTHLTGSTQQRLESVISAVLSKDVTKVVESMESLRQNQVDQQFFFRQLCAHLHYSLLVSAGVHSGQPALPQAVSQFLLNELQHLTLSDSTGIPFLSLELKLLELITRSKNKQPRPDGSGGENQTPVKIPVVAVMKNLPATKKTDVVESPLTTFVSPISPELRLVSDNLQDLPFGDAAKLLQQWDVFVGLMTQKNSSVAALLRSAKPLSSDQGTATVAVFYKFHKEQLQQPKFKKMIDECTQPLTGGRIVLEFVLADAPSISADTPEAELTALAEELLL